PAAGVPPVRGDTPPWLEQGAAVLMPKAMQDLALPSRRHPGDAPAEPLEPMRAWVRLRAALLKHLKPDIEGSAAHWQAAYAEAWQRVESRRMEGSPESDAVLMAIVVKLSSQYFRDDDGLGAAGVAFMAGRIGLEGAVDALLTAQTMGAQLGWERDTRKRRLSLNDDVGEALGGGYAGIHSDAEWQVRGLLARAGQAQWQACADKIRAALPLLPPSRQPAMAMLLPDLPALSNETALRLQGPAAPASLHWLQLTATDPAAVAVAQRQKVDGWGSNFWGAEDMVATVLRERGAEALPVLAPGAAIEAAGEGLAAIGLPGAVAALGRVAAGSKPAMARFQEATRRWPLAALAALPGLALAGGKDASLYAASLTALLQAHPAQAERVLPWLSPGEGDLLRQLQARLAQPAEAAAMEDLPAVLADPPWLRKKRAAAAGPLALAPLDLAAVERWDEGQREEWLAQNEWQLRRYDQAKAGDVQQLASEMGFDRSRAKKNGILAEAMVAIRQRDAQALIAAWQAVRKATSWCSLDGMMASLLPEELVVPLFNAAASEGSVSNDAYVAARFGLKVLPGVLGTVRRAPTEGLPLATPFGAIELAAPAARALARLKSLREAGRAWLLRHPEHAAAGLIPAAVGRAGEARDEAA
ncbi:polymerase, partial [Cupriavidus basilensis]|nr:polymerase [Cupriavidus basilensis]